MRLVKDFVHGAVRVSIFNWNNKYLIKLETGQFEQTFKINELELDSEEEVHQLINSDFINQCMRRFEEMSDQLGQGLQRLQE